LSARRDETASSPSLAAGESRPERLVGHHAIRVEKADMEQSKKTPRQDPSNTNVRCTACGALLAKISDGELTFSDGGSECRLPVVTSRA
jgi:hypothetical protein